MTEQINIDELERLAKAATPGPWSQSGFRVTAKELGYDRVADTEFDNDSMAENAAFIAAANPATVLTLINQLRALGDRAMHLERRLSDVNGEVLRLKGADQHALKLQAGHDEAVMRAQELEQERDALAAKLKELEGQEPVARIIERIDPEHSRLQKQPAVARTYEELPKDSFPETWREGAPLFARPVPAEQATPVTRPGWRDINDIVADREKDPSKAAALDRAREWLLVAQSIIPVEQVNPLVLDALKLCQGRFAFYVGHHTRSGNLEKAAQNQFFADLAAKAIAVAEGKEEGPQAEPVRLEKSEVEDLAWGANQEALSFGVSLEPFTRLVWAVEQAVLRKQGYKVEG